MYYPVFITKKTMGQTIGGTKMIKTKPFIISQSIVLEAYSGYNKTVVVQE